jgi:formylglycine-generating enzyme required for sulfatase activity
MLWIPGGEALLGSPTPVADAPQRRLRLDGFWLDATKVTNEQLARFVVAPGYSARTWHDAVVAVVVDVAVASLRQASVSPLECKVVYRCLRFVSVDCRM